MTMQNVESTNVKSVGHDAATGTMRIEFRNGGTYDFPGVSPEDHAAFLASDSKGKHFHKHIRSVFPATKVA